MRSPAAPPAPAAPVDTNLIPADNVQVQQAPPTSGVPSQSPHYQQAIQLPSVRLNFQWSIFFSLSSKKNSSSHCHQLSSVSFRAGCHAWNRCRSVFPYKFMSWVICQPSLHTYSLLFCLCTHLLCFFIAADLISLKFRQLTKTTPHLRAPLTSSSPVHNHCRRRGGSGPALLLFAGTPAMTLTVLHLAARGVNILDQQSKLYGHVLVPPAQENGRLRTWTESTRAALNDVRTTEQCAPRAAILLFLSNIFLSHELTTQILCMHWTVHDNMIIWS
jgi:hypothetical protein